MTEKMEKNARTWGGRGQVFCALLRNSLGRQSKSSKGAVRKDGLIRGFMCLVPYRKGILRGGSGNPRGNAALLVLVLLENRHSAVRFRCSCTCFFDQVEGGNM